MMAMNHWCPSTLPSYSEQLMQLYCARQRRRLNRGLRRKQQSLLKRLRKAKKEAPPMEKPEVVKTHLRDMVILPEMVGSMVGVYNGKTFNQVEIKVRGLKSPRLHYWSQRFLQLESVAALVWKPAASYFHRSLTRASTFLVNQSLDSMQLF